MEMEVVNQKRSYIEGVMSKNSITLEETQIQSLVSNMYNIGNINGFCENYKKYQNNESALPFDQHMLIGLIAPRYVYIASASLDEWAGPENELRSARLASHFYEIYNLKGLVVPNKIQNNISYNEGRIAYHSREGIHDLTPFDWKLYMDYFEKIKEV